MDKIYEARDSRHWTKAVRRGIPERRGANEVIPLTTHQVFPGKGSPSQKLADLLS